MKKKPKAMILALVSTKGGTGKSTLAACLAAEMKARGKDVALLDTDPQQTLSAWHRADGPLQEIPIGAANGASVEPSLESLAARHEVVIVDTAGFRNRDTLAVVRWSDIALIPFAPTPADALGAAQTVHLLSEVNATVERRRNPVRILLAMNGAGRGSLVTHIRREVVATGATVLETSIARRVAYAEAMLAGSAPCWMGASAKPAAAEIAALADELI